MSALIGVPKAAWPIRFAAEQRRDLRARLADQGHVIEAQPAWLVDVPEVVHTVGLYARCARPELVVIGLPRGDAISLLASLADSVLDGQAPVLNQRTRWGGWGESQRAGGNRRVFECVIVHPVYRALLPALDIDGGARAVPLVQFLHSDAWGRLPGDADCDVEHARAQPRWDRAPWAPFARTVIDGTSGGVRA